MTVDDLFLDTFMTWAAERPDILAIAIVGSHARGTAGPDSDLDVVIIVDNPAPYLQASAWLEHFGHPCSISHEDWGLLQSTRVLYSSGREVEFGITSRAWASIDPIDSGTRQVVSGGMRVVYDPRMLLSLLVSSVRASMKDVQRS